MSARKEIIDLGLQVFTHHCAELRKAGKSETLDAMTLVYLSELLYGDGDVFTVEGMGSKNKKDRLPLHTALKRASDDEDTEDGGGKSVPKADTALADQTLERFAHILFEDAFNMLSDKDQKDLKSYTDLYAHRIEAFIVHGRNILTSEHVYVINLTTGMQSADKLIQRIVKLDKLPEKTSKDGLELLRDAWSDYDVANHYAKVYKVRAKVGFFVQLLLGFLIVVSSVLANSASDDAATACNLTAVPAEADGVRNIFGALDEGIKGALGEIIFILALVVGFLISLEGYFNSKARWRHLRASVGVLESEIWLYRTRTGPYTETATQHHSMRPEVTLVARINEWRDELVSAGDMKLTDLERHRGKQSIGLLGCFMPYVYIKCQYQGNLPKPGGELPVDDHHSPTPPELYVQLRVDKSLDFYGKRVPVYTRARLLQVLLVLSGALAASILSRYKLLGLTTMVTALTGAITSWVEFSDTERKVERYTTAKRQMRKLLSWWKHLGEIERKNQGHISRLIMTAESIISEERTAWISTTSASKDEGAAEKEASKGKKSQVAPHPAAP